jgi:hypothetical protein
LDENAAFGEKLFFIKQTFFKRRLTHNPNPNGAVCAEQVLLNKCIDENLEVRQWWFEKNCCVFIFGSI